MTTMKHKSQSLWSVNSMDRWAIYLVFLVQVAFFPWFPALHSANELSRLYLAQALAIDHDVEITPYIEKYGDIGDKSVVLGRYYSDKPPGTAFISAPGIALRRLLGGCDCLSSDMRVARLLVGILPTFLLLGWLRREMEELGVSVESRSLTILAYGLGSLAFPYSILLYGHQPVAVLLFGVFFLLRKPGVRPLVATMAAFLAGLCLASEYQSAVYLAPLAVLFLIRVRPLGWGLLAGLAGLILPIGAMSLYHNAAFGSPFVTGYSHVANQYFASVHAQGFMGVSTPRLAPLIGSFVLPSKGLFVFSPFFALGFLGLWRYRTAVLSTGGFVLRLVMVFLPVLFVSSMVYWDGGWTVGQRHLTPILPFLVAPAALLIDRFSVARMVAPALAVASIMMTGVATLVFPHLPENFANPFHDLIIPLLIGGCVAVPSLGIDFPAIPTAIAVLVMVLILLIILLVRRADPPWRKALAVVLLVALPVGWYVGTARISRLDPKEAESRRAFFVDQCRGAGSWNPVGDRSVP